MSRRSEATELVAGFGETNQFQLAERRHSPRNVLMLRWEAERASATSPSPLLVYRALSLLLFGFLVFSADDARLLASLVGSRQARRTSRITAPHPLFPLLSIFK